MTDSYLEERIRKPRGAQARYDRLALVLAVVVGVQMGQSKTLRGQVRVTGAFSSKERSAHITSKITCL